MNLETENNKKLKDFFDEEYQSLKFYVNNRIHDTVSKDAEDIIQDVALKLFSGADSIGPINNVAGFVYRSVRNMIIDVMRKKKPHKNIEYEDIDITDTEETADVYLSEKQLSELKKNINELKPHYRDIIIAVDIEGYTYKEIALETGIPEGTLMSRRHRAIGILYKKLDNN